MRTAVLGLAILCLISACTAFESYRDASVELKSLASFDPARYAGTWYEIASYPTPFQAGCTATRADYGLKPGGGLTVRNACLDDGVLRVINGEARVVGPGRLEVRLDGVPFAADYWVLWVDADYRTAVVGTPSGRAGWILSRTPSITADHLAAARDVLAFNGYDLAKLEMTRRGAE